MRTPFVAGNWKMHKTVAETVKYVKEFRGLVKDVRNVEIVLAPPFTALHAAAEAVRNSNVGIAAQDLHWEREGAFTGAISGPMIRETGAEYVIVGHSERRQYYGETDVQVNRKTHAGLTAGLTVIMCVGETLDQREQGSAESVVSQQLTAGSSGLTASDLDRIIVAYEPVWAIGTGRTATPEQAQEMHAFIRRVFAERHSQAAGAALRILYGGSVKPDNIAGLMSQSDIDGALVGGASLKAESFAEIVNYNR